MCVYIYIHAHTFEMYTHTSTHTHNNNAIINTYILDKLEFISEERWPRAISDGLMVWECALTEPGIGAKLQLLDGGTCLLFRCADPNLFQALSMTCLVLTLSFLMSKGTLCTLFFWKTVDHFLFLCTGLAIQALLVPFLSPPCIYTSNNTDFVLMS